MKIKNSNTEKNHYGKLIKVWSLIGMILTAVSLISLFGDLRIITFSDFIKNVIISYRNLFHPILEFLNPFNFQLNTIEKDFIYVFYFTFERLFYLVIFKSSNPKKLSEAEIKKSNRIVKWLYKVDTRLSPIYQNSKVKVLFRICYRLLFLILVTLLIKKNSFGGEPDSKEIIIFILLVGILFLPSLIILGVYLISLIRIISYYMVFPILVLFFKMIKIKKAVLCLRNNRAKNTPKKLLSGVKKTIAPALQHIYFNFSVLLLVLLILGLNFYLKNLGM